jgi:probable HAF family extracellular repeat protein
VKSSLFIAAVLVAAPAGQQAFAAYDFSNLSDPSGANGTIANGINDAGVVVGASMTSAGELGFIYAGGTFTDNSAPGASSTINSGISANNTVIGSYYDGSGASHGFTLAGSSYSSFDAPFSGATGTTFGTGISQAGSATVGYFFDAASAQHGFVNSAGYTQLDAPSATATVTTGVNNAGTTVGYFSDAQGVHGFTRSAGGVYTIINDPSAVNGTFVTGINDSGEISGYYLDGSGNTHGFVLAGTNFVTVDAPGASGFTVVNGINDFGTIVGYDVNAQTGQDQGFTATVPEPATLSVLGFSALTLLYGRRRRSI